MTKQKQTRKDTVQSLIQTKLTGRPMSATADNAGLGRRRLYHMRDTGQGIGTLLGFFDLFDEIGIDAGRLQQLVCRNGTPKKAVSGQK